MNLQPFQVVKCQLSSPLAICYGTMLYFNPDDSVFLNKHQWAYLGSFQWINTKKLYEYIGKNKITYDTSDAETFIPNNVPFNRDLIRSYGLNYATDMDGLYRLKHFDEPDGFEYIMNKQVDSYILSKFYEFYYYITKKVT